MFKGDPNYEYYFNEMPRFCLAALYKMRKKHFEDNPSLAAFGM